MIDRPDKRRWHLVTNALILCIVIVLALGFLGSRSQMLDALSHFRAHLAVLLLVVAAIALFLGETTGALVGALVAGGALYTVAPFVLPMRNAPRDTGPSYTLLQMNLLWHAEDRVETIRRIADARPYVITVQELTADWLETFAPLESSYPYRAVCPDADGYRGDSAVFSRRPFVEGTTPACDSTHSLAVARIDFNGVPVTIASHHQLWPWPDNQWGRLEKIRDRLRALPAPVLLAGDFNAVGWSAFLQAYARATGTRVVRGVGGTWVLERWPTEMGRYIGLGIDNALASPAVTILGIERLPATASDHLPVLIRFSVAPPPPEPTTEVAGLPAHIVP